jgi:hypothetical protein
MSKFNEWLKPIPSIVGFISTITIFIIDLQNWIQDPNTLHALSIATFALFVIGALWFFIKSTFSPFLRWASLVILFISSAFYFAWVGTWVTESSKIMVEKGKFAPEQVAAKVSLYQGVDDPSIGEGTGWFEVSSKLGEGTFDTSYTLAYDIPPGSKGYTGIVIWFTNPQDFTEYKYVELKIKFRDPNGRCRFILKDSFKIYDDVVLGDGKVITATTDEQPVILEISKYFSNIALNSVKEIDLDANGYFFDGSNSFTVSHIRLVK